MSKSVIVIGAGIIGASIAYHLSCGGARVTILDAGSAGGLATRASWAWINASWGNPEFYFRFRIRSMQEWRRLAPEIEGLDVRWCGGLLWDLPPEKLDAYAREHASWGYGIRTVDRREAQAIEPSLAQLPEHAVHVAEEGVVEPFAAAQAFLDAARKAGVQLREHTHVKRVLISSGAVSGVETEREQITADLVVLAAGAGVPPLAASVGVKVPLTTPPGLLVHSKPAGKILNGLVMAPELHLRQTAEGRLVAGSDFGGADPGTSPEDTARHLFAKVQAFIKDGDKLEYDFHAVGYRPTPADDYPVIGPAPGLAGLYLAVMHSGITNAPAVGLFAAREILDGERDELLGPFALGRFAET